MGLIGFVDPSHDERAADFPGRLPAWMSVDDLLATAARSGPDWSPYSYETIQAIVEEHQERDYLSTSLLTGGCARSRVLERMESYIDTVDANYAALMGTLAHRTVEYSSRDNSVAEWRFWTHVDVGMRETLEVSCSPDIVTWEPDGLGDYKRTETPPQNYPWMGHKLQLEYNAFIVRNAERWANADGDESADLPFDVRTWKPQSLYVAYLGPKGPATMSIKSMQDTKAPNGNPIRKRMPDIWTDEQVLSGFGKPGQRQYVPGLKSRLLAMAQALASYPEWPFVEDEDRPGFEGPEGWACPGKPWCSLPNCLAKRFPNGLVWPSPT